MSGCLPMLPDILAETLENIFSERGQLGDIQTCVALCEVVGGAFPDIIEKCCSERQRREWSTCYIEVLHQLELWNADSACQSCEARGRRPTRELAWAVKYYTVYVKV